MRKPLTDATFNNLANQGEFIDIAMRDGYQSQLLVQKPLRPTDKPGPLIVLMFGGGFVGGENRQLAPYGGALCHLYGATVVNLSYRLAPEHPFPAAQNDVWDTLIWLSDAANAKAVGADLSAGFVIGGVSAGANLSACIAQRWVDEGNSPKLTGIWLSVPYIFDPPSVPEEYRDVYLAREQNAQADIINDHAMKWVNIHQKPDFSSPLCSPMNSKNDATRHKGMPPTYIQVAGQDPLRDDGLIYERVLRKAGVSTRLHVYPGVPHAHFALVPSLKASLRSTLDTLQGFAWLLKVQEPSDKEAGASLSAVPSSG